MAKNADLNNAARAKKDEFYTQLTDIEKEMRYYREFFKGKTVFCNCDDPFESNFFKYFAMNFNPLGLKKLIATCYATSPVAGEEFEYYVTGSGQLSFVPFSVDTAPASQKSIHRSYKIEVTEVTDANGDGRVDLSDVEYLLKNRKNSLTLLDGDGDFRSSECVELLKQADVIVTNPPFSLFRDFVSQLVKYEKHFLIIGNINAITYKEVFPLIMQNRIWLGASIHSGDREFRVPDSYPLNASGCRIDENGIKYIRVKGVRWFTNIDYAARHEDIVLYKHYTPEEYPHYDNYDAIEVSKTADIPCDYYEEMGVPITYLDKHNPDQFDIVGSSRDLGRPMSEIAPKGSYEAGGPRFYLSANCSQFANVERERERETPLPQALRQNCHQTQDVTASWAYQSPSSTSSTPTNLKLSEQPKARGRVSQPDCGAQTVELPNPLSAENASINDCLLSTSSCNGIMGVPITFLDKYNPEQFEIIGIAKRGAGDPSLKTRVYTKSDYSNYSDLNATPVILQANGVPKNTYPRILIRRKQVTTNEN